MADGDMLKESGNLEITHGNRKFYELPEKPNSLNECSDPDAGSDLISYIESNIIGNKKVFSAPYGLREVTYCDYTASGRSLHFLEDYIKENVLPEYGNTHTTSTVSALQTTLFRHEARDIVRNSVGASEHDAVIFVGSGCTAAVHKLIHALALTEPPVAFVGPYEHHSNLLPWREVGADIIHIQETTDGLVDLDHLRDQLKIWQPSGRQLIGCFAAASNVTGILADVDAISVALHRHGALAFWDYATAGPYVDINMNPVTSSLDQPFVYKDAVFISTHKFVGGVQTPGILVAKKKLFRNNVPSGCGGGSVFFVRREEHRYLQEVEMREEGGTPAIVESIRAGLVFQLKDSVTAETIMQREHAICSEVIARWKGVDNLVLLGSLDVARLPIFSFLIRHPGSGLFLHHNFVTTVLNDLFGIQTRGGCACAGPYAEDLLGIDEELAAQIEDLLAEESNLDRVHLRRYNEYSEREIIRPGFVRVSLHYCMSSEALDFVIQAVRMVAEHGWKLLPQYKLNPETGEWRHRSHQVFIDRQWLGFISYKSGQMTRRPAPCPVKGPLPTSMQDCLEKAKEIFNQAVKSKVHIGDQTLLFDEATQKMRWFLLPSEAYQCLQDPTAAVKITQQPPFTPTVYPKKEITKRIPSVTRDTSVQSTTLLPGITLPIGASKPEVKDMRAYGNIDANTEAQNRVSDREQEHQISFQEGLQQDLSSGFIGPTGAVNEKVNPTLLSYKEAGNAETNPLSEKVVQTTSESHGPGGTSDLSTSDPGHLNAETKETNDSICIDGSCFMKRKENKESTLTYKKCSWHSPPKSIFKPSVQAIEEHRMIQDGDRVLICLSGGKDSLSLLHTIRQYQFYAKSKGIKFEFGAVTIDPMTNSYDPSPLKGYLAQLKVPYFYEEQAILETAENLPYEVASICSFCSRMKRGRIYHAARREKYNVLAFGQHLDDLSESFLMSVFHNGSLRTMKAHYTNKEGDLRIIRPFIYVREVELRQFAEEKKLPVIPENCPACFEAPKERHRMKQLLAQQEVLHPLLFYSLGAAMKPLMSINTVGGNVKAIFNIESDEEN